MDPSYNNSFGSPVQQPIVGSNDVVTSRSTNSKKTRFWLLILGFVITVAIVFAVVFVFYNKKEESSSYVVDFYSYLNYLLYGEDKADRIDSFVVYDNYFIDDNYGNKEYLDALSTKYNAFYNKAKDREVAVDDGALVAIIGDINSLIEYDDLVLLNSRNLFSLYNESGPDAAMKYIKDFYGNAYFDGDIINSDNDNNNDSFFLKRIKEYDIEAAIQKIKCWSDANDCINSKAADEYAKSLAYDTRISLKRQTLDILKVINGGDENEK